MAKVIKNTIKYDHFFDRTTKRHQINGVESVLHCHHYTSLYTQLALDAGETELLKESARESVKEVLNKYFLENPEIIRVEDKIDMACQYYSLFGLGKMNVKFLGSYSGEVELLTSHTDTGWIKKWGNYDKPINFITAGFIEAMFESVLDMPAKSFITLETQSIVMGNEKSIFKVRRK
jgi:predicted hydrocarbon binding protein